MRIPIDIPVTLFHRLKARAAIAGTSAKKLIFGAVEQVFGKKRTVSSRKRIKLPRVTSKRPGTVRLGNARICDIISFP
jgi:hypothetical protein